MAYIAFVYQILLLNVNLIDFFKFNCSIYVDVYIWLPKKVLTTDIIYNYYIYICIYLYILKYINELIAIIFLDLIFVSRDGGIYLFKLAESYKYLYNG